MSREKDKNKSGNFLGKLKFGEKGASITSGITSGLSAGMDFASSFIDVDENSSFGAQQAVGDAISKLGPWGAIIGTAFKGASMLDQALGINMNTISKKEANEAGISGAGRILNNVAGFLPGTGLGVLAGKTMSVQMSDQTKQMSNAFGGSVNDISTAEGMSGGRYLIGKNKINSMILDADRQNRLITDISVTNTQRKASDYGQDLAQQNLNRYAGNNYQNTHVGKHGMKLMSIEECKRILEARKGIEIFHNGGVLSGNILPTGKLHKELHHIEDFNPELAEELTRKGIPVVAINEDGNFEEVAEIERDEWTLSKELTDKLESLWKDGSEEAMLECGKLMCEEILFNTRDDNNLLGNGDDTDKD